MVHLLTTKDILEKLGVAFATVSVESTKVSDITTRLLDYNKSFVTIFDFENTEVSNEFRYAALKHFFTSLDSYFPAFEFEYISVADGKRYKCIILNTDNEQVSLSIQPQEVLRNDPISPTTVVPHLYNLSLDITSRSYEQMFEYFAIEVKKIFNLRAALITEFDSAHDELVIRFFSLNKSELSLVQKVLGRSIQGMRIKLTQEQKQLFFNERIKQAQGLEEISFGAIPHFAEVLLNNIFRIGWSSGAALKTNNQLYGTIIFIGHKGSVPPNDDDLLAFVGLAANALHVKKTEEQLKNSELLFRTIFESSQYCISVVDSEQRYLDVNPALLKFIGKNSRDEVIGKRNADIDKPYHNPDIEHSRKVDGLLQKFGEVNNYEFDLNFKDGSRRTVLFSAKNFSIHINNFRLTILHDITERKEYERQLMVAKREAEELSAIKSSFLSNMSHELRTPMIGILGYSELIEEETKEKEIKIMAEQIYTSGQRLMDTFNKILDLSRIESEILSVSTERVDISEICKSVLANFETRANSKSLSLEFETSAPFPETYTDPKIVRSIIHNLVDNAIKFTETGGVKLGAYVVESENANQFVFQVCDSGVGIPDNSLEIIFDEFRQASEGYGRHFEGAGLGLAITKKLVDKLGGIITVQNNTEEPGCTFTVILPTLKPE